MTLNEIHGYQEILKQKEAELLFGLRNRAGIVIDMSSDQMDEIQYASERDLAIRNVDRESAQLREVRAALRRASDGSFGECSECEAEINPRRLRALPWALRCVRCQEAADRSCQEGASDFDDAIFRAA